MGRKKSSISIGFALLNRRTSGVKRLSRNDRREHGSGRLCSPADVARRSFTALAPAVQAIEGTRNSTNYLRQFRDVIVLNAVLAREPTQLRSLRDCIGNRRAHGTSRLFRFVGCAWERVDWRPQDWRWRVRWGNYLRRSLKLFIAVAEMLATKRNFRATLPAWFPLGEAISERLRQASPVGRRLHSFGRSAAWTATRRF